MLLGPLPGPGRFLFRHPLEVSCQGGITLNVCQRGVGFSQGHLIILAVNPVMTHSTDIHAFV